jgi:hypothetical protein
MSCPRGCCATYREHITSITLHGPSQRRQADRQEALDMDAYKRLRRNGVQPKQIAGCAELERGASTTHEVEHSNIITDPQLRRKVTHLFESAPPPTVTPNDAA